MALSFKRRGPKPTSLAERFWKHVDCTGGPEACWPWHGATVQGYGVLRNRPSTRMIRANRLAWELTNGCEIPLGHHACHHCDNPGCCNPAHIFIGPPQANMTDKVAKGRQAKGERGPRAKLSESAVREILARFKPRVVTTAFLAGEYGVSQTLVWRIVSRKAWKHIA